MHKNEFTLILNIHQIFHFFKSDFVSSGRRKLNPIEKGSHHYLSVELSKKLRLGAAGIIEIIIFAFSFFLLFVLLTNFLESWLDSILLANTFMTST